MESGQGTRGQVSSGEAENQIFGKAPEQVVKLLNQFSSKKYHSSKQQQV
jgi:hypothetical protein